MESEHKEHDEFNDRFIEGFIKGDLSDKENSPMIQALMGNLNDLQTIDLNDVGPAGVIDDVEPVELIEDLADVLNNDYLRSGLASGVASGLASGLASGSASVFVGELDNDWSDDCNRVIRNLNVNRCITCKTDIKQSVEHNITINQFTSSTFTCSINCMVKHINMCNNCNEYIGNKDYYMLETNVCGKKCVYGFCSTLCMRSMTGQHAYVETEPKDYKIRVPMLLIDALRIYQPKK